MGGEAGNLVAQTLATADGDFSEQTLVRLEVESETRVVLFNEEAGSLLDRLSADTTLWVSIYRIYKGGGWMDGPAVGIIWKGNLPSCI
jgi:hypothetical protein